VLSRALASRRHANTILATICVAAGVLALSGSAAQAALVHPLVGSFGSFSHVSGVAVDQSSGDVYVLDSETSSISKFDGAGAPVDFSSSGTNTIAKVASSGNGESEIAVDSSSGPDAGDIYVADNHVVEIYSPAGDKLGELTGGGAEGVVACGVAVDPAGEVYVGFYPGTVNKYTPAVNPVSIADKVASMSGLDSICNVAVDSQGSVYAATYFGGVSKYEALQFGSPAAMGTVVDTRGNTLAVDPSTNDVYIDEGSQIAQYSSSGGLIGGSGTGTLSGSTGVAIKGGGDLYAATGVDQVAIFGATAVLVPDVTTQPVGTVTDTAATLNGSVDPDGLPVTACKFEYRTEAEATYEHVVPCSSAPGSGGAPVAVSAQLGGLLANTAYH
jgi:hypothetical protein